MRQAEWQAAFSKHGGIGALFEVLRAVLGLTTWPFFVDSSQRWSKKEIQEILNTRGIKVGGWGYSNGRFMFRVKKAHARWAEYLMLEQGVPIVGKLLTGGYQPIEDTADVDEQRQRDSLPERPHPQTNRRHVEIQPSFFCDPIESVNRFADSLFGFD